MALSTQPSTVADWRLEYVAAWRDGKPVTDPAVIATGRRHGLPAAPPFDPAEIIRYLYGAGFPDPLLNEVVGNKQLCRHVISAIDKRVPIVISMHADGYTVAEIAEALEWGRSSVYYHLRSRHLRPNTRRQLLTARQMDEIARAHRLGETATSIAHRLGVRVDTVRKHIQRHVKGAA